MNLGEPPHEVKLASGCFWKALGSRHLYNTAQIGVQSAWCMRSPGQRARVKLDQKIDEHCNFGRKTPQNVSLGPIPPVSRCLNPLFALRLHGNQHGAMIQACCRAYWLLEEAGYKPSRHRSSRTSPLTCSCVGYFS